MFSKYAGSIFTNYIWCEGVLGESINESQTSFTADW